MRDSRRARLILALLVLTALTLITLDYRSGGGGPLRSIGNAVFGPIERAVGTVVRPIGSFFGSLGHLNSYKSDNKRLTQENEKLKEELRLVGSDEAHLASAEKLLHLAGAAQFRIVPAHVVAYGSSLGYESTATIDVGTRDGVQRDQTVMNGDGLVGKTLSVGPTTSTILLGNDSDFAAGARLEGSEEIGTVNGHGRSPMTFTLFDSQATMHVDERLVTFPNIHNQPFVAEVPIGYITKVQPAHGALVSTAVIKPYVDFSSIDIVAVVVGQPRNIKRDSLLPPTPTPTNTPSSPTSPNPSGSTSPSLPPGRISPTPTGTP